MTIVKGVTDQADVPTSALPILLDAAGRLIPGQPAEGVVATVGGIIANPSANFTRPSDTTAYASGDLVANSTTAGSVAPMQFTAARVAEGSFMVRKCRLWKSGTSITNSAFRLHLWTASPTPTNGDNGAFVATGSATYIGALDIPSMIAFSDGAAGNGVPLTGSELSVKLSSGQVIYGLLEARGAYTPGNAESFAVVLEVIPN